MDVRFYETEAGRQPVREYLRALSEDQRLLVGRKIRAIQDTDIRRAGADVAPIKGKLWELRAGFIRVFYVIKNGTMWLLHVYQKDTEKAPDRQKAVATQRMNELLARR